MRLSIYYIDLLLAFLAIAQTPRTIKDFLVF